MDDGVPRGFDPGRRRWRRYYERRVRQRARRRADPADNTAKLFRHLASETVDAETVHVRQLFTTYYDLASGGVSSKRQNAEFVGERVADAFEHVDYTALTLPLDPPKRGGELPPAWKETVDETAASLEW